MNTTTFDPYPRFGSLGKTLQFFAKYKREVVRVYISVDGALWIWDDGQRTVANSHDAPEWADQYGVRIPSDVRRHLEYIRTRRYAITRGYKPERMDMQTIVRY